MDAGQKKSHANANKRTTDNVEAALKASANKVFANVFAFCTH